MPQAWEVRCELLAERSFSRPGWRRDNEKNSPPVHRRPRVAGCWRRGAGRGG